MSMRLYPFCMLLLLARAAACPPLFADNTCCCLLGDWSASNQPMRSYLSCTQGTTSSKQTSGRVHQISASVNDGEGDDHTNTHHALASQRQRLSLTQHT